jgi:hypothetical protein
MAKTALPPDWYKLPLIRDAEIAKHGSVRAAARANGIHHSTLQSWIGRDAPTPKVVRPPVGSTDVTREDVLLEENRELKKALDDARRRALYDERAMLLLERAVEPKQPTYTPPPIAEREGFTPHEFLLQWSDLHGCERVSAEQTNGLNEYGWDVMVARHWRMREAILGFKRHRPYPVSRLTIWPGGDMVSGDIHDELRETNEKVLVEAAIDIGYFGAEWIASLAPEFPEIVVDGMVVGNHGRRTKKPQAKNQHDNFDWIVYEVMRLRLANLPNVRVVVGKDGRIKRARHQIFEVAGKKVLAFHGDGVRSTMVGVPWGGITRRCNELQKQYEAGGRIDHFLVGHWHTPHVVDNRRILVNGCVKGPDEYGISLGLSSPAGQLLHTFHPRRGLTDVSFLDLQD